MTGSSAEASTLDSPTHKAYSLSPVKLESQRLLLSPRRAPRTLSKVPYKVLDAPELAVSESNRSEILFIYSFFSRALGGHCC